MGYTRISATNEIFCSYVYQDRQYVEKFRKHLSGLQREGIISCWYDGLIKVGQHRQHEIETHLNSANIILLFISADFLDSNFCMQTELSIALDRSGRKEALVIPIIVRPSDWKAAPFAHLQALPREGKPIAMWRDKDEAYVEIVESIRSFVYGQLVPPMHCPLHNLPLPNPMFTGREDILRRLHAGLESRKKIALAQALSGLGGIGKTQTVIEYAHRYRDDYTRVIWFNGESHEKIILDMMELAHEINTPDCYDKDPNIIMQGFLAWLETQRSWLLILDNVENIGMVRSYMPKGNQGHLLLTTRRQAVGGAIEGIALDIMDEETGAIFLLKRAKRITSALPSEQLPVKEMQSARNLSRLLGGLPLALDQAGGFIDRTKSSPERYLQIYKQEHKRLLAESGFSEDTTDYKHTVATTWSLSFRQVAQGKRGQAATDLLQLCAFLAPDHIPVLIFEFMNTSASVAINLLGSDLGQVATNLVQLEETLEALLKYSLIQRADDTFSIHRLVQTILRDAMKEERSLWIERSIRLMNKVFPAPQKVENWLVCLPLFPHMRACTNWIVDAHIRTEASAFLLSQTAGYLMEQGLYEEAEPLMRQALVIRQEVLGELHPGTARGRGNLAELYTNMGRYEEAEPLMRQALAFRQTVLGNQHPDTAKSLNALAKLYQEQGHYEEAESLYGQALATSRETLGDLNPETAGILTNLAGLYYRQARYEEAEISHKAALKIKRKTLGKQHPDIPSSLNGLAMLYHDQGRYEEAEPLMRQALEINREVLGGQHPNTVGALHNLAELYVSLKQYEEAERLHKEALAIRQEVLGNQHPNIATSLSNLAALYLSQERYEEAEPLMRQALVIRQEVLGNQHPNTANSLYNLAKLYQNQGRYEEAEPLYRQALTICLSILDSNHPSTQVVYFNYLMFLDEKKNSKRKTAPSTPLQWIRSLLKKRNSSDDVQQEITDLVDRTTPEALIHDQKRFSSMQTLEDASQQPKRIEPVWPGPQLSQSASTVQRRGHVLLTYTGHTGGVNAVAWSPDGSRIASCSLDTTIQVWNANNGKKLLTYTGHVYNVNTVAWSPDGSRIASGSMDYIVQVWNANSGEQLFTYTGHTGSVNEVMWSPDGHRVASCSADKTVQVWDTNSGEKRFTYKGHSDAVSAMAWSPNGSRIASGSYTGTEAGLYGRVQIWNATSGRVLIAYRGHSHRVSGLAWSPDGKYIASCSLDETVQVWNTSNGEELFTYAGHRGESLNMVAWSPDGRYIVSCSRYRVQVWQASSESVLLIDTSHESAVNSLAWSPDGSRIASGFEDNTVQVWQAI